MRSIKILFSLSLLTSTLVMSGCGRSVNPNQTAAMPLPLENASGANTYLAPVPQTAMGNSKAIAGGRASATSGGYVYENAPSVDNNAYNYYNQQNPCLFPQPGQTGCQGGTNAYYGGQQPQQSTGAYPQYPNQANTYAGVNSGQAYPQQNYNSQANAQVGTYNNAAYPQNNNYAQTPTYSAPANNYNTYRAPVTTQRAAAPVASQNTATSSASAASKAISRINPNSTSGSSSSNNRSF